LAPVIYSLLYTGFYAATKAGGFFNAKMRRAHADRKGLIDRVRAQTASWPDGAWWVHIASSGELEQALPILDALRLQTPSAKIYLSYFSPSAKDAVALEIKRRAPIGRTVPWDYADYSPFDFSSSVEAYLAALRPRCFVTIHRELWPGLVAGCRRRGIPVSLLAASFPKRHNPLPAWQRKQLRSLSAIGVTREDAAVWLQGQVPGPRIKVVGDPRVERVLSRRDMTRPSAWLSFFEGQFVFLGASLWPKDFAAIRPALRKLKTEDPNWRLILVPHEPKKAFVDSLYAMAKEENWKPRLWSRWLEEPDTSCTLILDRVGLLAELYRVSQLVFIGGSFSHRVHNVLEPAAYGCRLFTGPRMTNSLEALELQLAGLLQVSPTPEAFSSVLNEAAQSKENAAPALAKYLSDRAKSSAACLDLLNSLTGVS